MSSLLLTLHQITPQDGVRALQNAVQQAETNGHDHLKVRMMLLLLPLVLPLVLLLTLLLVLTRSLRDKFHGETMDEQMDGSR